MTIKQQLLLIQDAIKTVFTDPLGGDVQIAIDSNQLWDLAAIQQDMPRVILAFEEQEVRGENDTSDVLGKVYNHFIALVSRGRGYDEDQGTDLAGAPPVGGNQGSSPPFYDLVESCRDAIRTCVITDATNEEPPWFKGIEKVPYDPSVPIYGYQIKFCIGTNIGDLVPQNKNN